MLAKNLVFEGTEWCSWERYRDRSLSEGEGFSSMTASGLVRAGDYGFCLLGRKASSSSPVCVVVKVTHSESRVTLSLPFWRNRFFKSSPGKALVEERSAGA